VGKRHPISPADNWVDSKPLTIAGVKGRVVVVEFGFMAEAIVKTSSQLRVWHANTSRPD
jgi:hypothetical protein